MKVCVHFSSFHLDEFFFLPHFENSNFWLHNFYYGRYDIVNFTCKSQKKLYKCKQPWRILPTSTSFLRCALFQNRTRIDCFISLLGSGCQGQDQESADLSIETRRRRNSIEFYKKTKYCISLISVHIS